MDYTDRLGYRETGGDADLAQLVEHSIRNAGVISSNLIVGTTILPFKQSSLIVASARVIAGILTITLKNNN